jgi:tRNA(fMet)-specific endonuclease VapC
VVDTCWTPTFLIALLEGDQGAVSKIEPAAEVFVPVVAVGELLFGAAKSGCAAENAAKVERFAAGRSILPRDLNVARVYGRVKQRLREKGRPIPENDLWIAATAVSHELVLVTRDQHFSGVDGLTGAVGDRRPVLGRSGEFGIWTRRSPAMRWQAAASSVWAAPFLPRTSRYIDQCTNGQ